MYVQRSNRGCIPAALVGLVLGGGFVGLGYSLGWMTMDYGGTVIGGGGLIALLSAIGVLFRLAHTEKAKPGTLILEGGKLHGPDDESTVWDLNLPHDIVVRADDHQALVRLTIPGTGFADGAPDEIGRQLANQAGPGMALHLIGVSAAQLVDCFELPAYVEPLDPAAAGGVTLDSRDPRQKPLLAPLVAAIGHCRAQNVRYQAFAALPWQQPPAPASPPLRNICLDPGVDPRTVFSALTQSPAGADPANPHAVIAKAYLDTRLWINQKLGITPDYLVIDGFGGLEKRKDHAFALIPIGGGRSSIRREMHRVTTTSTVSSGSTTYPAVVIEGPSLGAPIWVVFDRRWDNMDNEIDAAVAFVNRG
jgi:hypothetical protein